MDKHKLILPVSIILGTLIMGGFWYLSQMNKQESIERQQWIELQAKAESEKVKLEKDNADEIFSNNLKCQTLLKDLKQRWNNVVGIYYSDWQNTCIVKYTNKGEIEEGPMEDMEDAK